MDFDDSFFESEEQTCINSEAKKKQKENYQAKRCELEWFLEALPSTSDADSCEGAKGASGDFMLLKYKADLCYSLKDFGSAAPLFEEVLKLLPPMNAMVKREVVDSLARCYSCLGQYHKAKERAEQLILPPYDSDASSWKLLSQCQKSTGDYEAHVLSLQKCVAMERQHADFWLTLADGYRLLKVTCTDVLESSSSTEQWRVPEQMGHILNNTVSLFRPYFSWRDVVANKPDGTKVNPELVTEEDLISTHINELNMEPALPTHEETVDILSSERIDLGLPVCHKGCPFFTSSQLYVATSGSYSAVIAGLSTPNLTVCLLHSPFTILASRQATVEEFIGLLKNVAKSKAIALLCNFYTLAEYSCFLWAKQLLIYSARYSSSFAKVAMTTKLEQLEERLDSGTDKHIRTFLLHHFSQRTVFENFSDHNHS